MLRYGIIVVQRSCRYVSHQTSKFLMKRLVVLCLIGGLLAFSACTKKACPAYGNTLLKAVVR